MAVDIGRRSESDVRVHACLKTYLHYVHYASNCVEETGSLLSLGGLSLVNETDATQTLSIAFAANDGRTDTRAHAHTRAHDLF